MRSTSGDRRAPLRSRSADKASREASRNVPSPKPKGTRSGGVEAGREWQPVPSLFDQTGLGLEFLQVRRRKTTIPTIATSATAITTMTIPIPTESPIMDVSLPASRATLRGSEAPAPGLCASLWGGAPTRFVRIGSSERFVASRTGAVHKIELMHSRTFGRLGPGSSSHLHAGPSGNYSSSRGSVLLRAVHTDDLRRVNFSPRKGWLWRLAS
jgi:hypothetical protein